MPDGKGNGNTPVGSWRSTGMTDVDSILELAKSFKNEERLGLRNNENVPWIHGHELRTTGEGGVANLERRRIRVVGQYIKNVGGDRTITASDVDERVVQDDSATEAEEGTTPPPPPVLTEKIDDDAVHVEGNANLYYGRNGRVTMMTSGTFFRERRGTVGRAASQSSVICGGLVTQAISGPAFTLSLIKMFEGSPMSLKSNASRVLMSATLYRSAERAAWAVGAQVKSATQYIMPADGSRRKAVEAKSKLAKLNHAKEWLGAFVAPLEILFMVGTLAVGILIGPILLIAALVKSLYNHLKGNKKPDKEMIPGAVRTLTVNVSTIPYSSSNDKIT